MFKQPDLARTLKRIAGNPDDFYHGDMARELAASLQKGGGLITVDDLAHYEVKEREAVRGSYRGYEIISAPPPSSGGTTLIEILNILEGYDLAKFGGRSAAGVASDPRSLPARVFRPGGVSGRSGFFQNSRGPVDRQALWRGLAGID